jgi:hypothetical protein
MQSGVIALLVLSASAASTSFADSPSRLGGSAFASSTAGGGQASATSTTWTWRTERDGHVVGHGRTVVSTTINGRTTTHTRDWSFPDETRTP